ncbi:hypothetical protein ABHQ57_06915 [Tenacibaculum sp. ZH5_bin.1]|uniref:hypothetical protein n=1 Tax=unclassified Tenacibaculum TaxID=2635139 RepID=UPI0036F163CF
MNYIPGEDEFRADMKYEMLARYAFDCDRWGGPNNIADANYYDFHFVPKIDEEGTQALSSILEALISKHDNEIAKKEELILLRGSLSKEMKQKTGIELINYIYKILKE